MKNSQLAHILRIWRKIVTSFVLVAFLLTGTGVPVYSQELFNLPQPGTRVSLSTAFLPPLLKGVKVYPDNPFKLDFILDKGDSPASAEDLKMESTRLIKYFLASITVPEKDLWVNLSPYEKDRIVPDAFGVTEMGRDLLAQDYLLKQITASVIYPEGDVGRAFWAKVYTEAQRRYGTSDVPVDTFNKVWIVPEKAVVYESKDSAYVVESKLKVMLEEDYLALEKNTSAKEQTAPSINKLGSDIVREVVIPILEKEVNEGKNFTLLRQVYHSLILAVWYKDKIKESLLGKAYVDQEKIGGVDIKDKAAKDKIWAQYVVAFKKGAYNYIKEEYDPLTEQVVPRKYFSGGMGLENLRKVRQFVDRAQLPKDVPNENVIVSMMISSVDVPMAEESKEDILGAGVHDQRDSVQSVIKAWQQISDDMKRNTPNVEENTDAPESKLYLSMRNRMTGILHQVREGQIDPFVALRFLKNENEPIDNRFHEAKEGREMRLGFFAVAGNPLTIGHMERAVVSIDALHLDRVALRIQGEIDYKEVAEEDRVPAVERHAIAQQSMKDISPLITYTDLGSEPGSKREGFEELLRFLEMNRDRKIHAFYLISIETKERVEHYTQQFYELMKKYHFGEDSNHTISIGWMRRGEYGASVDREELEAISLSTAMKYEVKSFLNVEIVPFADVDISSTDYRRTYNASFVPSVVDEWARSRGYYGHSNSETTVRTGIDTAMLDANASQVTKYPALEDFRSDISKLFEPLQSKVAGSQIVIRKGVSIPLFISMLGGNPETDTLDALNVSLRTEKGNVAQLLFYDGRSVGTNALCLGRLFSRDLSAEEVLIIYPYVTGNFDYEEAREGLRKFKTVLARMLVNRKQTVDLDNESVLFSLAKAGAGLTESQISDAFSSMGDVESITEADLIRILEAQKRGHYPSQKFPSLGLYQAFFQTGGYKGLLDLAKRMGYSKIVVDVSFPDGFQNYLLYKRLGFESVFVSEDQKEYFHKAMKLFDESRKSGKSLSDSVWDLTTHLSHQMIPMSLDLGNQDAVAMSVSEQVRSSLAGISSVAKELRASRSINYVENYQINAIAQQFRQSFTGEFFSRKQSYIVSWVHRFAVFLSDLKETGPTVENISKLDGFIRRGNIISRIPDEYFRIFSEQQMMDILNALVGYLDLDYERSALIERLRRITGKDQLFVEKQIATALFIQDEIRRKITYQSVTQDERVFNVVGKRAGGGTLEEFTRLAGVHTFTPQEYKSFMFRFMMPEDLYQAIKSADGRARIALHVGKPNDSYIQDLLDKGFVLHSFRKSEKEKQYRNRSLYYRIGADGTVEIEFINVVDFGNLRHLIDFYLTVVDSVSVVDHMPDYEKMLLSLLKRKPFDFPINMVGVGAGYAMGTFAPEQFESFYDSYNDPQAAVEDQSPYLFRMMRDLPDGRALAGFNITLGELDTYSARLLLEQFPDAKAFISAGAIGLIGDQQYSYSDPNAVLPGDIFVPTTISDNFSEERINNRYADELVATLEENKISYQLIDMQGKQQKLLKEHSFNQGDHPIKVVLGKLFTVDSLAAETLDAIKKLRDADVRAVDMEASLVLKTVRSMRPDIDLYFGYQITDVPGAINLDSQDVNNDVQVLIKQKRALAVKAFSLTAHRILRQKGAGIKDGAQSVNPDAAMKVDGYPAWANYFRASTGIRAYLKSVFGKSSVVAVNSDMLAHFLKVRQVVNPDGRPLKVFYAGSGADVISPVIAFGAGEVVMATREVFNSERFKVFLRENWNKPKQRLAAIVMKYFGYIAEITINNEDKFFDVLLTGLRSLGLNEDDIEVGSDAGRDYVKIKKVWPGSSVLLETKFYFLAVNDLTDPKSYPSEMNDIIHQGFDVLIPKAAMNRMPGRYLHWLPVIGRGVRNGGYFVLDTNRFQPMRSRKLFDPIPSVKEFGVKLIPFEDANRGYGHFNSIIQVVGQNSDADPAMLKNGGIDLTRNKMRLQVQGASNGSQFKFDPAMIEQLQNASGFAPFIIDIRPMTTTVPMFLGLEKRKVQH